MFPADGKGRRISSQSTERESNEYFCISRFPWRHKYGSCDSFMVARWVHWNNPAEGKKARASLGQERQAEQEAHRKYREENAARRSQLRRWNIVMAPLRAIMNISVW